MPVAVVMTQGIQIRHFRRLDGHTPANDPFWIGHAIDAHRQNAPDELLNTVLFILPQAPAGTASPNPPNAPVGIPWDDITTGPYFGEVLAPGPPETVTVDRSVIGRIITTRREAVDQYVVSADTADDPPGSAVSIDAAFTATYDGTTMRYHVDRYLGLL